MPANQDKLGLIGRTVDGRYTIVEQIGEGGMGAVYRAQHQRLGRQVAIKFLHHELAKDHEALDRFFNEARAAATLGHPNIAESYDMGELDDGSPFIVFELLKGRSVQDELVRNGKLSIRRALRIARQIALGLDAAHQRGIIHRDLKAENVFLTDREDSPDHVKILDFGVARVLENSTNITRPGHLVGTPGVMPPEQIISPDTIDARVDIYAAGVILYHMLSGQKPYGAMPLATLLYKILEESPPPLSFLPDDVRRLVEDAMARDRDHRIQTMIDLRDRIDACVAVLSSPLTPPSIRIPTDVGAAAEAAAARASSSIQLRASSQLQAAPAPASPAQKVPGSHRRTVPLALGVGGAIALAGVLFTAFHSTGSSSRVSPPLAPPSAPPSAPVPVQVAANPAVARAAPDQPPARPGEPPAAPVEPPATPVHPRAMTTRVAAAHPDPKHPHAPLTRPQIAATPAPPAPATPIAPSAEPAPAHGSAATEPPAAPPAGHGSAAAVTNPASGSASPAAPAAPAVKKDEIDVAATRAAVRTHVAEIQQCYERAKMDDPSLAGAMTVRITIAPGGAVTGTQITKSTIGSPAVERCVTAEISHWHLPGSKDGNAASFLYPFVFE